MQTACPRNPQTISNSALPTREDRSDRARCGGKIRDRRCVITGQTCDAGDLLRIAEDPEGNLVLDLSERLPGRGHWVTPSGALWRDSRKRKRAGRALGGRITQFDALADRAETQLAARCLETIGLARRAGQTIAGFDRLREALTTGDPIRPGLVLAASDGSAAGIARMRAFAPNLPVVHVLTQAELGLAFGRESVVHAGISAGRLMERLMRDGRRLAGFRAPANSNEADLKGPGRHGADREMDPRQDQ